MIRFARKLTLLALLGALAVPAAAQASPQGVILDCTQDGSIDGHYSNDDLRRAIDQLPSDIDEYSDCREVIGAAIRGGSDRGGGRPKASAAGAPASAREQAARTRDASDLERAARARARERRPSIEVGGQRVRPGTNGLFELSTASNGLPLPLLLTLIAVGLLALGGSFLALRSRVPLLARIPLPSLPARRGPRPRFRR
jgi:hypothetical protein